jgi:formate-dependent nitrite reductase membrane component NrfD
VIYLAAEHFVRAPQWTWYILGYFFFAGLTGGSYAVATLLRLVGDPRDEPAVRIGFYASFVALLFCPLLLTVDLGASWWKFWHMLINVTPGDQGLNFKYWSPMSVGVWTLLIFALFPTVSALESFVLDRRARSATVNPSSSRFRTVDAPAAPIGGVLGRAFNIVGGVLALFIASYTGVLLSVSNQPIWSDTWMLGGLFLASGLSGAAALIALLTRYRPDAAFSLGRLHEADGYFSILEIVLLVAFFITVGAAGTAGLALPFLPLWLLALLGIGASLVAARGHMRIRPGGGESAVIARVGTDTLVVSVLVLLGVLALRAAVIFSAQ